MGAFTSIKCNNCDKALTEYYHIKHIGNDGQSITFDKRFCTKCGKMTICKYISPSDADPALANLMHGNSGKILEYLKLKKALFFNDWPVKSGLPSPSKIRNVARLLIENRLVRVDEEGVFLEEGVLDRLKLFSKKTRSCDVCGIKYVRPKNCPECGSDYGDKTIIRTGRACDDMVDIA